MDVVCVRYYISVNPCGTVDDDDNNNNDIIVAVLITFGNLVETRRFSVFFSRKFGKLRTEGGYTNLMSVLPSK
jgi:hypothetical protein